MGGEDLVCKPGVVEKPKFEYSALGKIFNKGLNESDEKEGLFKRLKKGKNGGQLKIIECKEKNQLGIKSVPSFFDDELSQEVKNTFNTLKGQEKSNIYKKFNFKRDKNLEFLF